MSTIVECLIILKELFCNLKEFNFIILINKKNYDYFNFNLNPSIFLRPPELVTVVTGDQPVYSKNTKKKLAINRT